MNNSRSQYPLPLGNDQDPEPPLILFCDFDGPIVDVSDRYYATYQLALTYGRKLAQSKPHDPDASPVKSLTKEEFWTMKQERVSDLDIALRSGILPEHIPLFLNYVRQIVNQPFLLRKDRLQGGVNWALGLLHSQGVKLVLVTLRHQPQVKAILNQYGLKRLFADIYGTGDAEIAYGNSANAKETLLSQAIARHGRPQVPMMMMGDTEADLLAAHKHNIPAIGLTCGIRSRQYLEQYHPHQIYPDLLSFTHHFAGMHNRVGLQG